MSAEPQDGDTKPLTEDEQQLFERLREQFEGDEEMEELCDLVLQSSDDDTNEEANS